MASSKQQALVTRNSASAAVSFTVPRQEVAAVLIDREGRQDGHRSKGQIHEMAQALIF